MHLGRLYPQMNRPDASILPISSTGYLAPRKWVLKNDGTSAIGTLATPWLNVEVLSTESTLASDGQSLSWDFEHPTVADNFIRIIWLWKPRPETSNPAYEIKTFAEFWFDGDKYGVQLLQERSDEMFNAVGFHTQQLFWQDLTDPPAFERIGFNKYYAALWEDDPDYQPYRTRPA